jgi:flagellar hook-associated protein FlgK
MSSDLLSIGASGVLAQQKLLWTTGNNITNVNTQGYTRQSTVLYTNTTGLGVGMSDTSRVLDLYAQREVWKDTSTNSYYQQTYQQMYQTDQYLSSSSYSVNTAMSDYFSALDTANSSANSTSGRESLMSNVTALTDRFTTLSSQLSSQNKTINSSIESGVKEINNLLSGIDTLNQQVIKADSSDSTTLNLIDQRDELIRQLAEKMDIRTVPQSNGSTLVNLASGESLVLSSGAASLSVASGNPDIQETQLQLQIGTSKASISSDVGGDLGGYFAARDALGPVQRELGQLSVALADAMNSQNSLGMTLNNEVGGDIFTLPTSDGLANANNTGTGSISVSFMAGEGSNVTPNDFEVRFTSASDFDVYMLDENGKASLVDSGTTPPTQFQMADYGIQLDFGGTPASGDKFTLQPTKNAASGLKVAITDTDDFALAAPVVGSASSSNYGSATIALSGVYNTGTGSLINSSSLDTTAPQSVVIDSSGNYEVYDGNSPANLIGVAPASTKGQDLMANLQNPLGGPLVYSDVKTTPGYDFDISGSVTSGDQFTISFNTDGFTDNYNGLALADLGNQDLVRKGSSSSTDNKQSFSQAYSSMVSGLGSTVSSLKSKSEAADAKLTQSSDAFTSVSGVSMDEEASNLIRFQQSYAASAQVITTAKEVFDTLLSAAR